MWGPFGVSTCMCVRKQERRKKSLPHLRDMGRDPALAGASKTDCSLFEAKTFKKRTHGEKTGRHTAPLLQRWRCGEKNCAPGVPNIYDVPHACQVN